MANLKTGDRVNVYGSDGLPCGTTQIASTQSSVVITSDGRTWTKEGLWVGGNGAYPFPYIRKVPDGEDAGWVIERWVNSDLMYWIGHFTDERGFLPDNQRAIRFAREVDAAAVLSWLLGGQGKVSQHLWIGPKCPPS